MCKFNPNNHYYFNDSLQFFKSYKIKSEPFRTFNTTNEIRERFDVIPTRRNAINATASVYDPLGSLNPIVAQMNIFPKVMPSKI